MKILKILTLVFLLISITCCGTATYQKSTIKEDSKANNIFVYRKYASPTAWSLNFDFNGKRIAKLAQHDSVQFYVLPGAQKFSISWPILAGGVNVGGIKNIEENKKYYFLIGGDFVFGDSLNTKPIGSYTNSIELVEVSEEKWLEESAKH